MKIILNSKEAKEYLDWLESKKERITNIHIDTQSNLEWHPNANHGKMSWQDAMDYCQSLGANWRLPTIEEFKELIKDMKEPYKELNSQGFKDVQSGYYWSSSSYAYYTSHACFVYMSDGGVYGDFKSYSNYVWPVRARQ